MTQQVQGQHEIPSQSTHSLKLEETAKWIRISVHVYANNRETAINEAIATYLETKQKADKEGIPIAPMEVINTK
jgi:hypothetical protein